MSKTPKSDAAAFRVNAYLQAVPLRLSQELENERAACHAAFVFEKDRNIINWRENARLQMELDASCNAEELRQVRAENARLREAVLRCVPCKAQEEGEFVLVRKCAIECLFSALPKV